MALEPRNYLFSYIRNFVKSWQNYKNFKISPFHQFLTNFNKKWLLLITKVCTLRLYSRNGFTPILKKWVGIFLAKKCTLSRGTRVKEDMPPDMPDSRGLSISISVFVDANNAGNVANRKSQTGILIFCNKTPIHWYSKSQATVETSTFGSEFNALRVAVEMVKALRYKLRMFGVPVDGPASVFCDNEAVVKNTSIPESTLKKKHHSISYHACREAVAAEIIQIAKEGTKTNLADLFTKAMSSIRREFLLKRFTY